MAGRLISQQANYRGDFGYVYRSSAIFYLRQSRSPRLRTTLSFLNYWPLKRGNQVAVLASVRDREGTLVHREPLTFDEGHVANYSPMAGSDFEGSVEIEAFANANLVIPYAAILGVYETTTGITFVHSYARAYSRHEVEDGRTIVDGEEGCWTLRDSSKHRSFAVFHNGPEAQPAQRMRLVVRNAQGETRVAEISQGELSPYETVKVYPADTFPDLPAFLGGQPGFGALSFRLGEGFTRMLVGTEARDGADLQVTHSNFDYGRHQTDLVSGTDLTTHMYLSCFPDLKRRVLVYPDSEPGVYWVRREGGEVLSFRSGQALSFDVREGERSIQLGQSEGRGLPARIVTALVYDRTPGLLPAECSLGVVHHQRPPKRMWWGACSAAPSLRSRIAATPLEAVYGPIPAGEAVRLKLHAQKTKQTLERSLSGAELERLSSGMYVEELFPGARDHLGGALGYFTLYSDYGGLWCFSSLEKDTGSFAVEHAF